MSSLELGPVLRFFGFLGRWLRVSFPVVIELGASYLANEPIVRGIYHVELPADVSLPIPLDVVASA